MSELAPEIKQALDSAYGPILAQFTLQQAPQGGAPEYIKDQWIGVALPVREQSLAQLALGATQYFDYFSFNQKKNEEPVSIVGIEAVNALEDAEKFEAAEFWMPYMAGLFTFRGYEGELESLDK